MAKEIFQSNEVKSIRPEFAPQLANGKNFLSCEQVDYLREIIVRAHQEGYSQEEGCEAWAKLLNNKSREIDFEGKDEPLNLAEALTVLFQNLSYYETKWHYVAFLEFNSRPERYID